METGEEKIAKLKEYFENRADVVMAFLFGSRAKGYARQKSDWDIGVYVRVESEKTEKEVWSDIERILGAETDMVVLNRAPAHIAWSIVRAEPLVIKNRNVYIDFLLTTSHIANDWYRTSEDYHKVFERSTSLSQEDRSRLEKIVQFLEVELSDFPKFEKLTWEEYANNRDSKKLVERWAEQLMNAVIDTAEIILASEKRVIPDNYREIVQTLGLIPPFDRTALCQKLSEWVLLRNILAHQYLDYRWKNLSAFIKEAKPVLISFTESVKAFLKED